MEARKWAQENIPDDPIHPHLSGLYRERAAFAFDAGREAAMARTCEWERIPNRMGTEWKAACGHSDYIDGSYGVDPENFCGGCGGRIVVAAQDRG